MTPTEAADYVIATAETFTQVDGFITHETDGCPNKEQLISRRLQAWDMRVEGHSYREIAKALGVSLPTAYDDVQTAAGYADEARKQKAERVLDFEDARCDKAQKSLLPKVLKGEPKAVMAYMRVSEHRARLLGLYAPEKHQVVGMVLTEQQLASSRSSLEEKLEQLRQRMVGPGVVDVIPSGAHVASLSAVNSST